MPEATEDRDRKTERDLRRERRRARIARLRREQEAMQAAAAAPPPAAPAQPAQKIVYAAEVAADAHDAPPHGPDGREGRMAEIRRALRRRRRVRLAGIMLRFLLFVALPTAAVAWYYYERATDMYASRSVMIFKSGGQTAQGTGGLLGLGGAANLTDSVSVQEYILSRDILRRLDEDYGYIAHFQNPAIDPLSRLAPDATFDEAYAYYRGGLIRPGKVKVGFDASEGVIRLEAIAADPESAQRFAEAIIRYAEEKVNSLNERSRNDGVRFAEQKVEEARRELMTAQRKVAEVQEQLDIYSVDAEAAALQGRIGALETEIDEVRAKIAKLQTVARDPEDSRYVPLRRELELKTAQLERLRERLTGDSAGRPSIARLSAALEIARVEQATANLMYASALSSLETAMASAASQSLYLETVVRPALPVEATKPERAANTALAFLVLFAAYIIAMLTISLIREQAAI